MASAIIMPKVGQSVETCILTEWYKKKGDVVKQGELLFSFETDKASVDEDAKADGILLDVFYNVGDEVTVLCNIGVIGQAGESYENLKLTDQSIPTSAKLDMVEKPIIENNQTNSEASLQSFPTRLSSDKISISPRAKKLAESNRIPYHNLQGSGPDGRIITRDIEQAGIGMTCAAFEQGENSNAITNEGTGIGGRINTQDISSSATSSNNRYETKKLSNIRKRIAEAMHKSLQNSAQLTHHISADVRAIQAVRAQLKAENKNGITINDMVCFSIIKALKQHPDINGHFMGDEIREYNSVHLGIAVDTPRGLMVPAIKHADKMSIDQLSTAIKARAEECRGGGILPDLLAAESATFTVSNLGMYGIEMFTPVLNIPQMGIIGVNTIIQRPTDIGNGIIGIVPFIGISLTYDHKAIDGAPASRFLQTVKKEIETFSI